MAIASMRGDPVIAIRNYCFHNNFHRFQDVLGSWWKLAPHERNHASYFEAREEFLSFLHGRYIRYWCDTHQCHSVNCAHKHGCQAIHHVDFDAASFQCRKCRYKGKLDLSRIPKRFKNEIKRATNCGESITMCSTDGVWLKDQCTKSFHLLGRWKDLPLERGY